MLQSTYCPLQGWPQYKDMLLKDSMYISIRGEGVNAWLEALLVHFMTVYRFGMVCKNKCYHCTGTNLVSHGKAFTTHSFLLQLG